LEFRGGTSLGQRALRGRNLDAMAAPFTKHRRTATLSADGRTHVCRGAKTRGDGVYPRQLSSVRVDQRKAFHLLLGRPAAIFQNSSTCAVQKFAVPGIFSAGVLGTRSGAAKASPRGMAVFVAASYISDDLLFRLPSPEV